MCPTSHVSPFNCCLKRCFVTRKRGLLRKQMCHTSHVSPFNCCLKRCFVTRKRGLLRKQMCHTSHVSPFNCCLKRCFVTRKRGLLRKLACCVLSCRYFWLFFKEILLTFYVFGSCQRREGLSEKRILNRKRTETKTQVGLKT